VSPSLGIFPPGTPMGIQDWVTSVVVLSWLLWRALCRVGLSCHSGHFSQGGDSLFFYHIFSVLLGL